MNQFIILLWVSTLIFVSSSSEAQCPPGFAASSDTITGTIKRPLPSAVIVDPFNPKGVATFVNCGGIKEPGLEVSFTKTPPPLPPVATVLSLQSRFANCNKVKVTAHGCVGNTPETQTIACSTSFDYACVDVVTPTPTPVPTATPKPASTPIKASAQLAYPMGLQYPPSHLIFVVGRKSIYTPCVQYRPIDSALKRAIPHQFSIIENRGALPPGVTLDASTGFISGTPTATTKFSRVSVLGKANTTGSGAGNAGVAAIFSIIACSSTDKSNYCKPELWRNNPTNCAPREPNQP